MSGARTFIASEVHHQMSTANFVFVAVIALLTKECSGFSSSAVMKAMRLPSQLYCTPVLTQLAPKVPSTAWKWPPSWPFPVDFLELVDLDAGNKTVLSTPVVGVFQQHIKSNVPDGASVLD